MISRNTVSDMPKVTLRSVLGTTFMCERPALSAMVGNRSTGTRSMKLNRNTQQKMVSASGAISLLEPW